MQVKWCWNSAKNKIKNSILSMYVGLILFQVYYGIYYLQMNSLLGILNEGLGN